MDAPDLTLSDLHQRWQALHSALRAKELELSAALSLYTAGRGPVPEALMDEVTRMRSECNRRFKAMMASIQDRADARANLAPAPDAGGAPPLELGGKQG